MQGGFRLTARGLLRWTTTTTAATTTTTTTAATKGTTTTTTTAPLLYDYTPVFEVGGSEPAWAYQTQRKIAWSRWELGFYKV